MQKSVTHLEARMKRAQEHFAIGTAFFNQFGFAPSRLITTDEEERDNDGPVGSLHFLLNTYDELQEFHCQLVGNMLPMVFRDSAGKIYTSPGCWSFVADHHKESYMLEGTAIFLGRSWKLFGLIDMRLGEPIKMRMRQYNNTAEQDLSFPTFVFHTHPGRTATRYYTDRREQEPDFLHALFNDTIRPSFLFSSHFPT